jgi:hypothetical protein
MTSERKVFPGKYNGSLGFDGVFSLAFPCKSARRIPLLPKGKKLQFEFSIFFDASGFRVQTRLF